MVAEECLVQEALHGHVGKQRDQRVPVAVEVDDEYRLLVLV